MSYEYYFGRLRGNNTALSAIDSPAPGFYRHYNGDAVAYYHDVSTERDNLGMMKEGPIVCVRGGTILSEEQGRNLWPYVAGNPVPEEEWRRVAAGGDWSNEGPRLGHNRPPDDMTPEARALRITDLAQEWLKANPTIENRTKADQAAHYITELRQVAADLEESKKRALSPWSAMISQVTYKFTQLINPAKEVGLTLKARLGPFLQAEDERLRQEREAAQQAADEAREMGHRAPARVPTTNVGGRGHKITLRGRWRAEIVDYQEALKAASQHEDVKEAVQGVANKWAKESKGKEPL